MVQLYILTPDEVRARFDEFMKNGGQARLDALKASRVDTEVALREAFCPDPATLDEPMTI